MELNPMQETKIYSTIKKSCSQGSSTAEYYERNMSDKYLPALRMKRP
jgi:hypothetical protein